MKRPLVILLPIFLVGLLLPATAMARPAATVRTAPIEVGHAGLAAASGGRSFLLVPVHYPIELAGRVVETRVRLVGAGGKAVGSWVLHERLSSGRRRRPEKRRRFTFVHRIGLDRALTARLGRGLGLRVTALGLLDANGDGRAELRWSDRGAQRTPAGAGGGNLCSTVPRLRVRPGRRISVPLPACATGAHWIVLREPENGFARIRRGRLIYRSARRFRGRDSIELAGKRRRSAAQAAGVKPVVPAYVQLDVGAAGGIAVRAIGDSVTAGFGYYSNGSEMGLGELDGCRPAARAFNDACSSNSLGVSSGEGRVEYAPDYGLANDVSWAAQWANEYGVSNYENLAVSGSEPANWAPGGEFHDTTARIEAEDPDYILMTMGANPLLSEMLFGIDNMGCAIYSDVLGGYRECIEEAFAGVRLRANLKSLYTDLVEHTQATIYLMQYHLSIPSVALAYSSAQIAEMGKLLNREIAAVAAEVNPRRLQVVTPPHFDVGIDISPVYPSHFSCSRFGYKVDGPSVQSTLTQVELRGLHLLSFCPGPPSGPPWVISGDTGIHPSAAGYAQMASQVPAPGE